MRADDAASMVGTVSDGYVPLRPIAIKDRAAIVFLEYGQIDVIDNAFVLVDKAGVRVQVPIGGLACLMLEPGTRITHAAVMVWVGEGGVRVYAAGQPGGARADRLLYQAKAALDEGARLKVVRRMYSLRFGEEAPARRSVDQLRGIEGARVRQSYRHIAALHGVTWIGRRYDANSWSAADVANRCLSSATSCLYGLTEAAVLAAGYAPAIGFLHRGKPLSFVYDIADLFKFETVVPAAFSVAARHERVERIIPSIAEVLAASGIDPPDDAPEGQPPALPEEVSGNDGHRG